MWLPVDVELIPPFISFQWRATAARQVLETPLTERDIAMPQPPQPGRPSCDELDIWEANSLTNVYTTHPCLNDQCDPYGCGFNTYAHGDKYFYGRGPGYQVDSTQRFTVVTRFVTVDGTDNGNLKEIQRFYIHKDRTIQQPTFNGFNGLSDAYCSTFR